MNSKLVLGIIAGVVIIGGLTYLTDRREDLNKGQKISNIQLPLSGNTIACTEDAKICPDGSHVGRTGSSCEFAECPPQNSNALNQPGAQSHGFYVNGISVDEPKGKGIRDDVSSLVQILEGSGAQLYVLFFHAPWCPYCKTADKAFLERESEIPNKSVVIKVDYDTHPELKKKYGVTYQHTFVQVDKNGSQITKWNGGDIDNLKKYLK